MLRVFYDRLLLTYPKIFLLMILLAVAALGYEARKLEIDASALFCNIKVYNSLFKSKSL